MHPQSRNDFKIAIVCALPVEFDAVEALFDEHYASYGKQQGDSNFYRTGRIHKCNIVLVCLPEMGKRSAASVASSLKISFPGINLTLLVGICGGVPFPSTDTELILGDVIISSKVAEYDFGKLYPDGFQQRHDFIETLGRADRDIRSFLSALKTDRLQNYFQEKHSYHLTHLKNLDKRWQYPGSAQDQLFEATYRHKHQHQTASTTCICTDCESSGDPICDEALESDCNKLGCFERLIKRNRLTTSDPIPRMHFGSLGSGDTVIKSGEHRDKMAQNTGIIGFEMEGVGICDSLRCVIIKGVSDYADSHKNKAWQEYAAATAASCTKALLEVMWETMQEGEEQRCLSVESLRPQGQEYHEDRLSQQFQSNTSSIATDSSTNGQAGYQWNFSSRTSSIENLDHHVKSLEEELRRLKNDVSNPILRKVLVSGVAEAIKSNPDTFRSRETMSCFHSSSYKTRFGTILYQTKVIKQSTTAFGERSVQYKTTTSFIFHPASWLIGIGLKYGIEATTVNSQTGWQYSISPVRAVQDDALIFQFSKTGNVDAVQELFKRGDASVLDMDSNGWRPLHFATSNGHLELARYFILQGADRTARVHKSGYGTKFTPASFILTNRECIKKALDMTLLFHDCIDFDGPMSDGWNLVTSIEGFPDHIRILYEVLSTLFRKFRSESIDDIDIGSMLNCLQTAIHYDIELVRLILDFDPKAVNYVDFPNTYYGEPAIHLIAAMPSIDANILKLLLDRGTDIHMVASNETATSVSLWFSKTFFQWHERLRVIYQEVDGVIKRETSSGYVLLQDGWRHDTLRGLLALKPTEKLKRCYSDYDTATVSCHGCFTVDEGLVNERCTIEPWWEELKYRVKTKKCICSLLGDSDYWMIDTEDQGICSPCRRCRKTSSGERQEGLAARTTKLDSKDEFDSGDRKSGRIDHQGSRQGCILPPLEIFLHVQNGRWNGEYSPDEYYCFECLAGLEGWEMSDEDHLDTAI